MRDERNSGFEDTQAQPLRRPDEGFTGERETYLRRLERAGELPADIQHLLHQLDWPAIMEDPTVHVVGGFDEYNYNDPDKKSGLHKALDIQMRPFSSVISPLNLDVVTCDSRGWNGVFELRDMADLFAYSQEYRLMFHFIHLKASSLSEKVRNKIGWSSFKTDVKLRQGEDIGTVTKYLRDTELDLRVEVPSDVEEEYGRTFDHLHVAVHYWDEIPFQADLRGGEPINPILLFKRLY